MGGKDAALDVTVSHPLQGTTGAAATPGHALTVAYDRKVRDAAEDCRRQGIAFIPLAMESLGGWHPVMVEEVRRLGSALARHTGQPEGEAIQHLVQRLSLLLVRGNCSLILNRVPSFPNSEIDGVE